MVSFGQVPAKEIRKFFAKTTADRLSLIDQPSPFIDQNTDKTAPAGAFGVIERLKNLRLPAIPARSPQSDTLFVGIPPYDSLIVTGTFTHTGPVMVIGNGILRFKHANATIVGDLYVWGDHALVTSDSSYLSFPQQYFYQRSLVIAGKGKVVYRNTTLDHGGLSHNLVLTDSARIELNRVTNIGFTTCGMNKDSQIDVDRINEAGEFVILDHSRLSYRHAKTILLWYHVPDSALFHYSFPSGDSVQSYNLDNTTPGISGISYSVHVDTSTDVMWALMPANGSDVSISDSRIRSIGLWFLGHDTVSVSGLVDQSTYSDYTADLTDRTLHLINSSVRTWSLYPMDTVSLNVSSCIVGEIGSEAHCSVITTGAIVDGSGGYWWSTDQTFMAGVNCMAVNAIRSSKNSIFIFAYSSLSQGEASAMGNSIMMIVQSQLPNLPVLYDGSCIWYSFIGKPSTALVDTIVPVYGSAWIDKTPISPLMDFSWYRMYWQKSGDTAWHPIGEKIYSEKRDEILARWDTHGLGPGLYYLKLVITDNTPDSNQNEAVTGITLLPGIFGVEEIRSTNFDARIFPDPVTNSSVLHFFLPHGERVGISVTDVNGKIIYRTEEEFPEGNQQFAIGSLNLPAGCYSCILKSHDRFGVTRFVKL